MGRTEQQIPENVKQWFGLSLRAQSIPPSYVREWLGEIVRDNYRLLYSIARGYFGDARYAEDAVQTSVLKALQGVAALRDPGAVRAWLVTITHNSCREQFRRNAYCMTEPLADGDLPVEPSRSPGTMRSEQQRLILAAINALPEGQAVVVRLRFLKDYDIEEIAQSLGLKRNAVEVRLHRALRKLSADATLRQLMEECQ